MLLALSVGAYLYIRLDDEIRLVAEHALASHYDQLVVSVGGARFAPGRGVTMFDVSFAKPHPMGSPEELLHIDELHLLGVFNFQSLASGDIKVARVLVRRPRLSATRGSDGHWNIESLLPPPRFGERSAPMTIADATLHLADVKQPDSAFVLRGVTLNIESKLLPDGEQGNRRASREMLVEGSVEDTLAKLIAFSGRLNSETGAFSLDAQVTDLRVTNEPIRSLCRLFAPHPSAKQILSTEVNGRADAILHLQRSSTSEALDWRCEFQVRQARVNHVFLPGPVTDLTAEGVCDPEGLRLKKLTGKCNGAEFSAACHRTGWAPNAPTGVSATLRDLQLDERLYQTLPSAAQRTWDRFLPAGTLDVPEATLTFDGVRWRPQARIVCRDLAFEDVRRFPYRLESGSGEIRYEDLSTPDQTRLTMELSAQGEGRPVHLSAEFIGLPCAGSIDCPPGWIAVTSPSMNVTDRLLTALPDKTERAIRMLRPEGRFSVFWKMQRESLQQTKPTISMDLHVVDGACRYDKFPYPLRHVSGLVRQRGKRMSFEDFVCRDGKEKVVTCRGDLDLAADRPKLRLWLSATAAPLDEDLHRALPETMQEVWTDIRPQGAINFQTEIAHTAGEKKPQLRVTLWPHDQSVSIEPTFFPYRMDQLQGQFVYADHHLTFQDIRARHGRTRIASDGSWTPRESGGWRFELANFSADQLGVNSDFRLAAPLELRRVIDRLKPNGGVNIHSGRLAMIDLGEGHEKPSAEWDVQIDCHQADLQLGVPVEDVFGTIRVAGRSTGDDCLSAGELRLDSLIWRGVQLTNIRGPLWADRAECRLGAGVADKLGGTPRTVTAEAYGGEVSLNARVTQSERSRYGLAITFQEVDLARFGRDYLHSPSPMSGSVEGRLNLQGAGATVYGLTGDGSINVTEARLYELPVLVAMLKVLRIRAPDTTAFNTVESQFTIAGEHLTFQQIDFLGDAVSLYGRGGASFDKQLDLRFHTLMGRNRLAIPMLRSLVGQASEQLLRLNVTGAIDDAIITSEALPVVSNVLEQFQTDKRPLMQKNADRFPNAAATRR